jgi:hypothetical protein
VIKNVADQGMCVDRLKVRAGNGVSLSATRELSDVISSAAGRNVSAFVAAGEEKHFPITPSSFHGAALPDDQSVIFLAWWRFTGSRWPQLRLSVKTTIGSIKRMRSVIGRD